MPDLQRYEFVWSFEPSMSGGIERDDGEWYRRKDVDAELARRRERELLLEAVLDAAVGLLEEHGWEGRGRCTCSNIECVFARACAAARKDAPDA